MNQGIVFASLAYLAWGLFPLYFLQVAEVPALEVVMHRTVWSMLFMLILLLVLRRWAWLKGLSRQPKILAAFALSAMLLASNWLVYVWAVQHQHLLDASLGYFINPLVNIALGFFFLHERPRRLQWLAVAIATLGVCWLAWQAGHPPWVALTLGLTFGFYGLLRKVATLGAMEGLTLETMMLTPFAIGAIAWWTWQGSSAMSQGHTAITLWLLAAGPLTAIPLLLFAAGARRIPMTTLGLLQYMGPTLQFTLGVYVFHEAFSPSRLIGFVLIWSALLLYSVDGWQHSRRNQAELRPA